MAKTLNEHAAELRKELDVYGVVIAVSKKKDDPLVYGFDCEEDSDTLQRLKKHSNNCESMLLHGK